MVRRILVVAEKPQAAEKIAKALSKGKPRLIRKKPIPVYEVRKGNDILRITSAKGHIFVTEFAKEVHEKPWHKVDPKWLLTRAPLTKVVRPESRGVLKILQEEARKADILIIATDYDREGENIGMQVAELIAKKVNPKIRVLRARFSSLTPNELRRAFKEENLVGLDRKKVDSSEVRQELDLRYGVAFTRLATMKFHERFGRKDLPLLSIGPCQTPTLWLIVERYLKHKESLERAMKEKKWRVVVSLKVGNRVIKARSEAFNSKEEAENLAKKLKLLAVKSKSRVVNIVRSHKLLKRPLPLNTPRLASLAARYLGLSAHRTLKLAEKLYLMGLISYPRTETDRFSPEVEKEVRRILESFVKKGILKFQISKPRNGTRDDGAHPPIHPKKAVKFNSLKDSDLANLYEFIVRHTAATFSEDAELTLVSFEIEIGGHHLQGEFQYLNRTGYLSVYKYEARNLTPLKLQHGDELDVINVKVEEIKPQIVQPISESELVKLMDKLGIGTDATFADYIQKLIDRGYVVRKGGRLIPTEYGLAVALALKETVPEVVDPLMRAKIESFFSAVERGEMSRKQAVREAISKFMKLYESFRKSIDDFMDKVVEGAIKLGIDKLARLRKRQK